MPTLYHNPKCSKSRQALQLLQNQGLEPHIVEYLKDPPSEATLRDLLKMLKRSPLELMRQKNSLFKELGLDQKRDDEEALITAMLTHPKLIERPIFVHQGQARIGRPPQDVLQIL